MTKDELLELCEMIGFEIAKKVVKALLEAYQSGKDDQRREWAGKINSLACIIIDGEISRNDLDVANDAIREVGPYLSDF